MEEPPSLRLLILQGPRQGETLQFKPGSAIRIGRVVRGNTLPIKDPGISSNHLSILTESGKWVLRDLDSSNGTVLDGSKLTPHTPFHLNDGSTIMIGELTSILVTFLHQPYPIQTGTGFVTVPEPGSETDGPAAPVAKPGRGRRGKGLKGKVQIQSIDENASVNCRDESEYMDRPASTRVTRNSKNHRSVIVVSDSGNGNMDDPEEKVEEPKNTRATRNSKNKLSVIEISDSSIGNSDALEEKVEEPKNTRVTRNSKNNKLGAIGDSPQNSSLQCVVENVERKKARGGAKRKKLHEEHGGKGSCNESENENWNGDGNCPDLEKLSLGEWFDLLEVHLPKQILDATEEMFDSMRQKAERLREYIIIQKDHKVEMPFK